MKIGIVATEFPPAIGGMEEHAAGIAAAFAVDNDVLVFTKEEYSGIDFGGRFTARPILTGRIIEDLKKLKHEKVDRWLTLNAAYSNLSLHVDAPVFAYCHGNDFLKPWMYILSYPENLLINALGKLPWVWRWKVPAFRELERRKIALGLAGARKVFINSRYTQRIFAKTFPSFGTPTIVSWPGVSEVFFQAPIGRIAEHGKTLRLLTVARLCTTKNIANVLRALAIMKTEIDFTYSVVGDGDLRDELEQLARDLGIMHQTRFLGSLSSLDVVGYMDDADLFVLPSLGESFGITYAEAAARGLPSLVSKTGGAMDAVVEDLNGVIVAGPEPDQIAEGLRRFSQMKTRFDRDRIRKFALQFRRTVIVEHLKGDVLGLT